jgi:hypothetical protein
MDQPTPSSTFSSRSQRRGRDARAHLACGAITLAVLVLVAAATAPPTARQLDIVTHRMPPEAGSYYLAHDRGGQVDHHVLYHGTDAVALARMREAQVLFLGNSRLMFALDRGALREFFDELGLTYYVLGFGHTEQDDFPARIIAKYDLRPEVVVVNADGFFMDSQSEWAAKTIEESSFDAWKLQFESEAAHRVRRDIHSVVPQYVDLLRGGREVILYRSRLDGTWFIANEFGDEFPFPWPPLDRNEPSARSLRSAEVFKQDLASRGGELVLCLVPSPQASIHRARVLAAHVGVPLVAPAVDGLTTIDQSHLSAASSWRFEQVFFAELREILQKQRSGR